jgi:hypothetical protein
LWPDLFIIPDGSDIRLLWRSDRKTTDERPIRFLTHGEARAEPVEVQETLVNFVESVIERLADCGIGPTRLNEEWAGILAADAEEVAYCRASARLGLDPYSEAVKFEADILRAGEELSSELLPDFLDSISAEQLARGLNWIVTARNELATMSDSPNDTLADLRTEVANSVSGIRQPHAPWELGYTAARAVRQAIGLGVTDLFEFGGFVRNTTVEAPDRSLHALGGINDAVALGRRQLEDSERFTLARALWNLLHSPDNQFLVTSAHTARQKPERAFAAELLAPAAGVAELIGRRPDEIGVDELESAERHFRVSSLIIQHQVDNQLLYV